MIKVFISYRRSDSEGYAGRLFDQLIQTFDQSDVFMDVDGIAPGENFVEVLDQKLAQTDVMLVVIGLSWLSANDETGRRRLDKADDYVYKEIAAALNRDIAVVPVLVGSAIMPKMGDLPDALSSLANKQAVWLRHNSFRSDVEKLTEAIKKQAKQSKPSDWIDFGQAIAEEYNDHFTINMSGEDYRLQLFFGSEASTDTYFKSHLLKDAIVRLIQEADVSGWENHEAELKPAEFWASILKAVVASYRVDIPYPTDNQSDADILRLLLSDIGDLGSK